MLQTLNISNYELDQKIWVWNIKGLQHRVLSLLKILKFTYLILFQRQKRNSFKSSLCTGVSSCFWREVYNKLPQTLQNKWEVYRDLSNSLPDTVRISTRMSAGTKIIFYRISWLRHFSRWREFKMAKIMFKCDF